MGEAASRIASIAPVRDDHAPAFALHAPWRCAVERGEIGPFWFGNREVVRRIFVTARDVAWDEIPVAEWHVERSGPLELGIRARHLGVGIDFSWEARLKQEGDALSFQFRGRAGVDMDVCRLGLVVLCPVELLDHARITSVGPGGTQLLMPAGIIASQPIIDGLPAGMTDPFSAIEIAAADGSVASLSFNGELFEIEDQRNWGDASFKIYCTPLRLGFPRHVARGTEIEHGVSIDYRPAGKVVTTEPPPLELPEIVARFVAIGAVHDGSPLPLLPFGFAAIDLDHLEGPLDASALPPGMALDIGMSEQLLRKEAPALRTLLSQCRGNLLQLRLYGDGGGLPRAAAIEQLRSLLDVIGASVPILAATRGYFVELNRGETVNQPCDGIAFPLSPSVHSDSLNTLLENGAVAAGMVASARLLTGRERVAIVPLAWKYPTDDGKGGPSPEHLALWVAATLIEASAVGVSYVALAAELVRRLIASSQIAAWLRELIGRGGVPVRVLGRAAEAIYGLYFEEQGGKGDILLANLGLEPRTLRLPTRMTLGNPIVLAGDRWSIDGANLTLPARSMVSARCVPSAALGEAEL